MSQTKPKSHQGHRLPVITSELSPHPSHAGQPSGVGSEDSTAIQELTNPAPMYVGRGGVGWGRNQAMLVLGMEKADMHRSGKKGRKWNSPGQGLGFGKRFLTEFCGEK